MHVSKKWWSQKENGRDLGRWSSRRAQPYILNSLSAMIWCAISAESIVSPFVFEHERVVGETYRKIGIHCAFSKVEALKED